MGNEVFSMIMNDERLDNIPLILETTQPEIWKDEIEWLYSLVKINRLILLSIKHKERKTTE